MHINSFKSIRFFSITQIVRIVVSYLFKENLKSSFLLNEKHQIDFLIRVCSKVIKCGNSEIKIYGERNIKTDYSFYLRRYSSDIDVFRQIYVQPDYPKLIKQISNRLNGSEQVKYIIDGGAYIGLSTFYWARSFPNSRLIAIEPENSNFRILRRNINENCLHNVKLENAAIWHQNDELYITKELMDKRPWAYAVQGHKKPGRQMVRAYSIHSIMEENKIDIIDVLKLDIEGAEKEVFLLDNKIEQILTRTRVLVCELHYFDDIRDQILQVILRSGFSVEHFGEDILCVNESLMQN